MASQSPPAATASTDAKSSSKPQELIFAPADSSTNARAPQFLQSTLSRPALSPSPFTQFHAWFSAAQAAHISKPEAMTLSTASLPSGRVSSRVVYLKTLDSLGFTLYSNWGTSLKAADVATNSHAGLVFWWDALERQVRVEGKIERIDAEESQRYYDLREKGSRIGAWASPQSQVLVPQVLEAPPPAEGGEEETGADEGEGDEEVEEDDGRKELEDRVKEVEKRFEGVDKIPVPDFWGGARVVPDMVEFWQGRNSRLHDRFRYTKVDGTGEGEEGEWKIERLAP